MKEGESAVHLDIEITLPPRLWCNKTELSQTEACVVKVHGEVEMTHDDLRCYQGDQFPQALIGKWSEDDSSHIDCGLIITDDNWFKQLWMPVVATIDRVVDGTQTRRLSLYQSLVKVNKVTEKPVDEVTEEGHCGDLDVSCEKK